MCSVCFRKLTFILAPCFVPSAEHGKYVHEGNQYENATSLTAMDQIGNGQVISFQCDPGYNIQVER